MRLLLTKTTKSSTCNIFEFDACTTCWIVDRVPVQVIASQSVGIAPFCSLKEIKKEAAPVGDEKNIFLLYYLI